jgi:hypothetical protein
MKPGRDSIGTAEELHAEAREITGLDGFGADDYREGLAVLLESYARDAALTPWGNRINQALLRGALVARQLSEAAAQQYPGHASVAIERPIVVTGLPRTGTTALHRLLCADPGHQGLEMWLTEAPQPRPPRATWEDNPAFERIQERCRNHNVANPEFMGVHYLAADMVEECWQLLRQSMMSIGYETLAHLPTYSRWLAQQDWTPAYRRHRQNLQVIGLRDAGRRWVLKNPSHLFALPALMAVYPDALVVQTHRDPADVIASVSSLAAQATDGQSDVFQGEVIGRIHLELWARGAERFMLDRKQYDPAQFIDVRYDTFTSDPIGTVETIYGHFGLLLSESARSAMVALHAESRADDRKPSHRYELSDFGLSVDEVNERFARYRNGYLQ